MFGEIASGGMATVHLGCVLRGPERGRPIALKRLRSHYLQDREFLTMFLDEARIVARIRHPNVVATSEVVQSGDGMFLVMEYVLGESLSKLLRSARTRRELPPPPIAARVVHDMLMGLHGAHETRGEDGGMLDVVHRDVSPQNVMVGTDGLSRVLDFGVAKAAGRAQVTREGQIKGKLAYMAPEQVRGKVDRRADVFAAAVVLWETLTTRRLHEGIKDYEMVSRVVQGKLSRPSQYAPDVTPELDAIVMRGLAAHPDRRHASAAELARDLVGHVQLASAEEVATWCEVLAREALEERAGIVAAMQRELDVLAPAPTSTSSPVLPSPSRTDAGSRDDDDHDEPTRQTPRTDAGLAAELQGEKPTAPAPPTSSQRLVAAPERVGDAAHESGPARAAAPSGSSLSAPTPFVPTELEAPEPLLGPLLGTEPMAWVPAPSDGAHPPSSPSLEAAARAPSSSSLEAAPNTPAADAPTASGAPQRQPSLSAEDDMPAGVPARFTDPAMRPYLVALVLTAILALVGATLGLRAIFGAPATTAPATTSTPAAR